MNRPNHDMVLSELTSHSPLSIGQLCDAGCVLEFTATDVAVGHNDILAGSPPRRPSHCCYSTVAH
jgi:hypothetical protein